MKRWAVFISGTGSNMVALLEKQNIAHVSLVVSSSEKAYGLQRAKRRSIPTLVFNNKLHDWNSLITQLKNLNITHVMLAGFMKILPEEFVKAFQGRIFNIHPSVLPEYPGLNSIERAFHDHKNSGCTLHVVDEGVDTGKVLLQKKVVRQETLDWTEFQVHVEEHKLTRKVFEINSGRGL